MRNIYKEFDSVTGKVGNVVTSTERILDPVRQSLFKRFPVLATLLVTFGISATFFGIERIIADITWLHERPFLIFFLGVGALVVSGKLYQKLG